MARPHVPTATAPYRGVHWDKSKGSRGAWKAKTSSRLGPVRHVTYPHAFPAHKAEDAARVVDVMALYLRGPDAILSFDGSPPATISRAEILGFLLGRPGITEDDLFLKAHLDR